MVGYRPTATIIKLVGLSGPSIAVMRSVPNQMLVQGSTMNGPQSTQTGGLPPWSLKYPHTTLCPFHPMTLPFHLVASPGLKFKSTFIPFSIKFYPF
jgi:hypothetical protein